VSQDNANNARALMIQHNIRLVVKNARQFQGRGVDVQDLIVEGVVGLTRAVERFDADRGFKFSTYAYWWIRQVLPACAHFAGHCSSHFKSKVCFPLRFAAVRFRMRGFFPPLFRGGGGVVVWAWCIWDIALHTLLSRPQTHIQGENNGVA
jgi:hypothetical protein